MSAALVLFAVSVSQATFLGNYQDFGIVQQNQATIIGNGSATSSELYGVSQLQRGSDVSGLVRTVQAEAGVLAQGAGVAALSGGFTVNQNSTLAGYQDQQQSGGPSNLGTQLQGLDIDLDQTLGAAQGSSGLALGMQTVVGVQVQVTASPYGVSLNIQPVSVNILDLISQ
jgi:hypothetical protein